MCGIVGYIGFRQAIPVLTDGLRRLEYRGYDSAGVAWIEDGRLNLARKEGKLSLLDRELSSGPIPNSKVGLGHTRWATHGRPSEANAHPHLDCRGKIAVVHNGIIENHMELKQGLLSKGHTFSSETDSEVIAHLVEECYSGNLVEALATALGAVRGSFAVGVLCSDEPDKIVAARRHSPLVIGIGEDETILASDIPAFLPYTREALFLEEDEIAVLTPQGAQIYSMADLSQKERASRTITWSPAMAEKEGYKHFMLKEIYEQPTAIHNSVAGRIAGEGTVWLPELEPLDSMIRQCSRVIFLACGTSWHAGLVARYWIEEWAGVPSEVELASEFRYRHIPLDPSVLVVAISQSGETADTLAGMRKAKERGTPLLTVCNVVGSTMTREADATVYTHAGPEIGVASTKAFTSQLSVLYLLSLHVALAKGQMPPEEAEKKAGILATLPKLMEENIEVWHQQAAVVAEKYHTFKDFLFLGRDLLFPVALEGALKLKEISYIHAEGYAAGEMKHGPIALIDHEMPVLTLLGKGPVYEKTLSNMEEVRSRKGRIICVAEAGDRAAAEMAEDAITVPTAIDYHIQPFVYTVPLQLLAYEAAVMRGCDVDQPRNLAKSVTVE